MWCWEGCDSRERCDGREGCDGREECDSREGVMIERGGVVGGV